MTRLSSGSTPVSAANPCGRSSVSSVPSRNCSRVAPLSAAAVSVSWSRRRTSTTAACPDSVNRAAPMSVRERARRCCSRPASRRASDFDRSPVSTAACRSSSRSPASSSLCISLGWRRASRFSAQTAAEGLRARDNAAAASRSPDRRSSRTRRVRVSTKASRSAAESSRSAASRLLAFIRILRLVLAHERATKFQRVLTASRKASTSKGPWPSRSKIRNPHLVARSSKSISGVAP